MWAMMEKLRISLVGVDMVAGGLGGAGARSIAARLGSRRAKTPSRVPAAKREPEPAPGVGSVARQTRSTIHVEGQLSRKVALLALEDQIDSLADELGDRDLGLVVELLQPLVLLGRDVDGRGDL